MPDTAVAPPPLTPAGAALALLRHLGHRSGEAHALDNLGTVLARLGQPAQGAARHAEALAAFGETDGAVGALNGLGEDAYALGAYGEAMSGTAPR
jgi:hypothetical protein